MDKMYLDAQHKIVVSNGVRDMFTMDTRRFALLCRTQVCTILVLCSRLRWHQAQRDDILCIPCENLQECPDICDCVCGNQAFVVVIDFEMRAKSVADGLLRRKYFFCPKVFYDVCGARLCTLESQNVLAWAARTLYRQPYIGHVDLLPECADVVL